MSYIDYNKYSTTSQAPQDINYNDRLSLPNQRPTEAFNTTQTFTYPSVVKETVKPIFSPDEFYISNNTLLEKYQKEKNELETINGQMKQPKEIHVTINLNHSEFQQYFPQKQQIKVAKVEPGQQKLKKNIVCQNNNNSPVLKSSRPYLNEGENGKHCDDNMFERPTCLEPPTHPKPPKGPEIRVYKEPPAYVANIRQNIDTFDNSQKCVLGQSLLFFNYDEKYEDKREMVKALNRMVPQTRNKILYIVNQNENHWLIKSPRSYLYKNPYVFKNNCDELYNCCFVVFGSKNLVRTTTKGLQQRLKYYRPNRDDSYRFVSAGTDCDSIHLQDVEPTFNNKLNPKFTQCLTSSYRLYNRYTVERWNIKPQLINRNVRDFEQRYKQKSIDNVNYGRPRRFYRHYNKQ